MELDPEKYRALIRMMREEGCVELRNGALELRIELGAVSREATPVQEVEKPEPTKQDVELRKAFRTLPPNYAKAYGVNLG